VTPGSGTEAGFAKTSDDDAYSAVSCSRSDHPPSASDIVTFARLDGEPAAGAGEDTALEAAAARARRTTLFCVFLIYWCKISVTK